MEPSLPSDRIVGVGLLTEKDLDLLGPTFRRLWPIDSAPSFVELLKAIDEAERELRATERSKAGSGN